MSITDELREWARGFFNVNTREALDAIADRIDAAHEREVTMARGEAVTELGYKVVSEYVKLPKDKDGVTIRVGDTLDGYGETTVVKRLTLRDDGWSMTCENGLWFCFDAFTHHEPTVEDVLREFTDEVWDRCCEGATASDSGIDELVAEFAAKLRLASNEE